jgi:hypothetical protein
MAREALGYIVAQIHDIESAHLIKVGNEVAPKTE